MLLTVSIKRKSLSIQEPDPNALKEVGAFTLSQMSFQRGFMDKTRNNR